MRELNFAVNIMVGGMQIEQPVAPTFLHIQLTLPHELFVITPILDVNF
jgi:hypothetical protein